MTMFNQALQELTKQISEKDEENASIQSENATLI